ncbi:MAG: hypothetical protein LAT51_07960 [Flavobacteriaceae bacterium]|nr:hypothetical protein [Flavobacteriaceae bacterium]
MKKITLITALFLMCIGFAQEQEENSENEKKGFDYSIDAKMGFSQINTNDTPNINGNSVAVAFDFSYVLFNEFRLMTGVQLTEVFANYLDASLDASMIMIPLKFRDKLYKYDKNASIRPYYGLGIYTNHLRRLTIDSDALGRNRETGIGWNFGWLVEIGTTFDVNQSNSFSIAFEAQNDFSSVGDRSKRFAHSFLVLSWVTRF